MHCTQCGQPIQDGGLFCGACGTPSPAATAASPGVVTTAPGPAAAPATGTKACPFCGEQIMQVAVRCRHCSSDLTARPGPGGIVVQGPTGMPQGAPSIVIQNVQAGPPVQQQYIPRQYKNPAVAMLLSIFFPGGGQFYNGHAGKGILIFCTCWLIIPWIWGIIDAYTSAQRINRVGF